MKIATTVSGSFHRHMEEIKVAVQQLRASDVDVLSPSDPQVVEMIGPFLFVASDRHRSIRLVQDRHLAALCASDFLWLVCPDGYVGQSASLEVGFAISRDVPIYAERLPDDLTLRQYVHRVDSIPEAIQMALREEQVPQRMPSLLLDPGTAINAVHQDLDKIGELLQPRVISCAFDPLQDVSIKQRRISMILSSGFTKVWPNAAERPSRPFQK